MSVVKRRFGVKMRLICLWKILFVQHCVSVVLRRLNTLQSRRSFAIFSLKGRLARVWLNTIEAIQRVVERDF
jgi:hypothetical protein